MDAVAPPAPAWSFQLRSSLYVAVNVTLLLAMCVGAAATNAANPRILYVLVVTLLCTSPLLLLERINARAFLLATYMAFAFLFFGLSDLLGAMLGKTFGSDSPLSLTEPEAVIVVSLAGLLLGYVLALRLLPPGSGRAAPREWPLAIALGVGLLFWVVGSVTIMYWQVYVIAGRSNVTLMKNIAALGNLLTTGFMIGQLLQPLGIVILGYTYATARRRFMLPLIVTVVCAQIVLGFIADYKSEAMAAGMLVIIIKTYVDGRLPRAWLAAAAIFIVVGFPVFQAQRAIVRGELGHSAADALGNIAENLQRSFDAIGRTQSGFGGAEFRVQSFWERASLKASVELIVRKTGPEVPFQEGATLTPILTAFVPRILWADKESIAVGQVMNKTFHVSEVLDTYISPSHVGEVYWNFGWLGTLGIMPLTGLLLGYVGARCSAYPKPSLTRLMIMIVTIVAFCVRAEGSIATEYVVWLRSVAAIGLLHLLFARRQGQAAPRAASTVVARGPGPLVARTFPNLLS